jgi:hypothetical protein
VNLRTWIATFCLLVLPLASFVACGDDSIDTEPPTTAGTGGSTSGTGGSDQGICLLNNCTEDVHCAGCSDNRVTCKQDENRCVACDPVTGSGCGPNEECSPYGICVPSGLTCPTDNGTPTIKCAKNSDCKACSPMHQVCDDVTGKCQACTGTNTQHCLQSDICFDSDNDGRPETCSPKCPSSCTADNDCSKCGGPGNEAHACFQHKCAQCSDTYKCPAGQECTNGVCVPPCGIPGPVAGTCTTNEDCSFCGDPKEDWACKTPVNDPTHGNCVPPANGCSDLGSNVAVLPEPYNGFTELCSSDADCAQAMAGIQFNVGEAIRDLVGSDELNLGFTKIKIQDANVFYGMPKCASIELTENISCGICVPCKEDKDCAAIPIDPLIMDLFKGDPLAQIAGALLVDLLWGDNKDHSLNFFCQPVAAGYGACIPCGNPLQACGQGGSGNGSGMCDHNVCDAGGPLLKSCSSCAEKVCNADSFCCDTNWDSLCVNQADALCGNICSGGNACAHDPCTIGDKLDSSCSTCVSKICGDDAFCCQSNWDSLCVSKAQDTMTYPDCANACGGGCSHGECQTGAALDDMCSPCATDVCTADPYCCSTDWDTLCIDEAKKQASCNC